MEAGEAFSPSSANQYLSCSAQYRFRKIDRLPDPPTGSLTLGSAVDAAIMANFEQKVDTHQDLPAAGVAALYRDAWDKLVRGEYPGRHGHVALPTEFRDDEEPATLKALGEALTLKYLDEAAPEIQPAAVQLAVSGRISGVTVRGYIDLLDSEGRVIDLKTAARKPSDISHNHRFQVATYRALCPQASGAARIDTLVKTKTPQLVQQEYAIDASDTSAVEKMYPLVQQCVRAGVFTPNRQHYLCSRKYCAFWRACEREFGGRVCE
jgi:putative RecB family exonuclease